MINLKKDIQFKTSRSGGKGGQHVNKVETAVEGYFHVQSSLLFTEDEKTLILEKLSNRINSDGFLYAKSQIHRTQLKNKEDVIKKINELVANALKKQKKRIATKLSKGVKQKRLENKTRESEKKERRKKIKY